ncbi:protein-tyrosine phosphatase family protein [Aliamphritea hakodatensis]|uniref:protein-tyrosine phosphatase family protein n=1 Tax=Aliamphritea hakodatensis TaxID=2895352 RepID=UPI0022FD653A|nr:hypothetical protein [Aliamphritea hakodatensis]
MSTRIYPITGVCDDRFFIMPHPQGEDLPAEIQQWQALNINLVVSMLTSEEQDELGLSTEADSVEAAGIRYLNFPVRDDIPDSDAAALAFVDTLLAMSGTHSRILFHCRGGVGRSSMMLTLLLSRLNISADVAFARITECRGEQVPESVVQRDWVYKLIALHMAG